jgi:hypothetical protein
MAVVYNVVINQGADWYINYFYKQPAAITNIVGNGTTVTFTADNGLTPGQVVSIDGVIPSQFNLQDVVVATATSTQFTVTNGIATAPYNITGFSAAMQLRSLPESPDAVLTLTTNNGGITITGATGEIAVHATAAQTGNINEGPYVYDLEITSNNNIVTRVAQGQAIVSAQVTR